MNRLAPSFMASLIMGAWFYMTAVGNFVAGKIGEATGGDGGEMTKELTLTIYNTIGWIAIGVGVVGAAAVAVRQALDAPRHARGRSSWPGEPSSASRRRRACIPSSKPRRDAGARDAAGGRHDRGGR